MYASRKHLVFNRLDNIPRNFPLKTFKFILRKYSFQLSRFAFDKEAVMVVRPSPFFSPFSIVSLALKRKKNRRFKTIFMSHRSFGG